MGHIVFIGNRIGNGYFMGHWVTCRFSHILIHSSCFRKVLLGSIVSILSLCMVFILGDHLGIIEDLGVCLGSTIFISNHSGVEDDSLGDNHSLNDGVVDH